MKEITVLPFFLFTVYIPKMHLLIKSYMAINLKMVED